MYLYSISFFELFLSRRRRRRLKINQSKISRQRDMTIHHYYSFHSFALNFIISFYYFFLYGFEFWNEYLVGIVLYAESLSFLFLLSNVSGFVFFHFFYWTFYTLFISFEITTKNANGQSIERFEMYTFNNINSIEWMCHKI